MRRLFKVKTKRKEVIMMRKWLLAGVLVLFPFLLNAQTAQDSVDVGVKVTVASITSLAIVSVYDYDATASGNVTSSVDDTVDFGSLTPNIYTVGSTQGTYAVALETQVNGVTSWDLDTKGTGDFATATDTFALDSLSWAVDGDPATQTFTAFTTTNAGVVTGQPVGIDTTYIDYKLHIPWTATPAADYKTVTRYTLITTP